MRQAQFAIARWGHAIGREFIARHEPAVDMPAVTMLATDSFRYVRQKCGQQVLSGGSTNQHP